MPCKRVHRCQASSSSSSSRAPSWLLPLLIGGRLLLLLLPLLQQLPLTLILLLMCLLCLLLIHDEAEADAAAAAAVACQGQQRLGAAAPADSRAAETGGGVGANAPGCLRAGGPAVKRCAPHRAASHTARLAGYSAATCNVHAEPAMASTHLPVRGSEQIMSQRAQGPAHCSTTSASAAGAAAPPDCCSTGRGEGRSGCWAAMRTLRQLSSAYAGEPPMIKLGLRQLLSRRTTSEPTAVSSVQDPRLPEQGVT